MLHNISNQKSSAKSIVSSVKPPKNDVIPIPELQATRIRKNTSDIRATLVVNKRQYQKIKEIAYWQRTSIKKVVKLAFNRMIQEHENLNGLIIAPSQDEFITNNNKKPV